MYRSLTELEELTRELSQAVSRGDNVSIRMFLSMRRDSLNQMARYQAACAAYTGLPAQDARLLRALAEDASPPACAGGEALVCQAARNRALLSRIMEATGGSASIWPAATPSTPSVPDCRPAQSKPPCRVSAGGVERASRVRPGGKPPQRRAVGAAGRQLVQNQLGSQPARLRSRLLGSATSTFPSNVAPRARGSGRRP